jgi:hypothetical protein
VAILAVILCARYQIDANVDDSWQILGSNRLEKPSCPAIPQLDLGSSTSLRDIRRVSLGDVA